VPGSATRLAGILALICVVEPNVVPRRTPFHVIWVVLVKPLPLAVRVNPGLPAAAAFGEMLVSTVADCGAMVKSIAFDL